MIFSCTHYSFHFDFNWCLLSTNCCFCFGKSLNFQDHSSDSHYSVEKFIPRNTSTPFPPPSPPLHPLPLFGRLCIVSLEKHKIYLIIVVMLVMASTNITIAYKAVVNIQEIIYCRIKLRDFALRVT